jgi:hypothetical protein
MKKAGLTGVAHPDIHLKVLQAGDIQHNAFKVCHLRETVQNSHLEGAQSCRKSPVKRIRLRTWSTEEIEIEAIQLEIVHVFQLFNVGRAREGT